MALNLLSSAMGSLLQPARNSLKQISTLPQTSLLLARLTPCLSGTVQSSSQIHLTSNQRGLNQFFDDPKNYGESKVRTGRAWKIDELRLKSNADLHKLWYVLYIERNMLLTMEEAAKEEGESFPSPERIDKVEESMANLENVVRERNKAYWQLEVSPAATGERPRVFRQDKLGRLKWHDCDQHLVPYEENSEYQATQGVADHKETEWFVERYREMKRKEYNKKRYRTARKIRDIFRRFPKADVEYLEELHPEFPAGYVRHLRDNLDQYDDPPKSPPTRIAHIGQYTKEAQKLLE